MSHLSTPTLPSRTNALTFLQTEGGSLNTSRRILVASAVLALATSTTIGAWSSEAQLRDRAHALRSSLALDALLLTRSEDGMTLFDDAGQLDIPAEAREVFDVTGAGDTVIATLAAMLACGLSVREAMPIANRAGGIVVGKLGTATVSYDELFGQ